jgi:membrane dipeptidase
MPGGNVMKKTLTATALAFGFLLATMSLYADGTDLQQRAREITRKHLLADTHIDVPYRIREAWVDVTGPAPDGQFDYPRAVAGGLNLPFMSIYTPAELEGADGNADESYQLANELIDEVEAIAARAPDKFMLVKSVADAEKALASGRIGLAMGMENGSPINHKLENVKFFHDRGIRYITLAHSLSNHISDSSYDEHHQWNGLSPFGREVVAEMNRVGIMVDVSHISDDAFWQVMEISKAPVIASHSSARFFTPGFERNMSDEMIEALAKNGGVIQINIGSGFLTATANEYSMAEWKEEAAWAKDHGVAENSPDAKEHQREYRKGRPFPYASVDDVVNQFDHVIKLVGIDHVGIGTDFDGVGDSLPVGLKDVSDYPVLVAALLKRGYGEEDIAKILGGNLLRVWRQVETYAREQQEKAPEKT